MISRFVFCLLWLALTPVVYGELAANVFDYLIGSPKRAELHVITPEIREDVILRLRRYAAGLHPETGAESGLGGAWTAHLLLLRLGDERTIQEEIDELRSYFRKESTASTSEDEISRSAQPLFIPVFAEQFSRNDGNAATIDRRVDDAPHEHFPISAAAAFYAIRILEDSPEFSSAVREWAKAMRSVMSSPVEVVNHRIRFPDRDIVGFRQLMREWWRENEQFFKERNYQAVKSGRLLPQDAANAPESVSMAPAPALNTSPPISLAASKAAPVASAGESSTPSIGLLWAIAAAAIASLAGLLFFWKRRA